MPCYRIFSWFDKIAGPFVPGAATMDFGNLLGQYER